MTYRKRWLPGVLRRIQDLAETWRIVLTRKARDELDEMELNTPLDESDVRNVLIHLGESDFRFRQISRLSGEWMFVFRPDVCGVNVYLKIILRDACVVISFHEDES